MRVVVFDLTAETSAFQMGHPSHLQLNTKPLGEYRPSGRPATLKGRTEDSHPFPHDVQSDGTK